MLSLSLARGPDCGASSSSQQPPCLRRENIKSTEEATHISERFAVKLSGNNSRIADSLELWVAISERPEEESSG
jgi:hypothetical protein